MRLALGVCLQVEVRLEPFRALYTVELPESREVLGVFRIFVLVEMLLLVQVGVDLVQVTGMPSGLLLGV